MKTTLAQLARLVKGKVFPPGAGNTVISGFAELEEANHGDITFLANKRYQPLLAKTHASAIIVGEDLKVSNKQLPTLVVKNPNLAFARIVEYLSPEPIPFPAGVHPQAIVSPSAQLGKEVSIQPFTIVQPGSKIGDQTRIYSHVYIGHEVTIGQNCCIYPNVVIRERCRIGNNVIIHSGSVIGADGFGYETIKGVHHKIPQRGIVVVQDNVEIGANVTIDRARVGQTLIGKGTKIDNLVQIAHNVKIGPDSIIVAQTGISGSSQLGKNVILGGQVGVVGHIKIGDNVKVGGKSVVTKDILPGQVISGNPAQAHIYQQRQQALIRKLPQLYQTVKKLQASILSNHSE